MQPESFPKNIPQGLETTHDAEIISNKIPTLPTEGRNRVLPPVNWKRIKSAGGAALLAVPILITPTENIFAQTHDNVSSQPGIEEVQQQRYNDIVDQSNKSLISFNKMSENQRKDRQ